MTDRTPEEHHLQQAYDGLVAGIYTTKQLVWAVPPPRREDLRAMLGYLVEQSHRVDEAEARIGGRATTMVAPSSHERRNLLSEAGNDVEVALVRYRDLVTGLADEMRDGAAVLGEGEAASMLAGIAEGLVARVERLGEA